MASGARIEIAMFAHGEGALLERAVDSVRADAAGVDLERVVILANGPSEDTWAVTRRLVREDPRVEALWIARGDKCNAWNAYVHEIAGDVDVHVFMDADSWVVPGSLAAMADLLAASEEVNVVAGLPLRGWRRRALQRLVSQWRWILGCLYCLDHGHLEAIRSHRVHLPVGLFGNDHFITQIAWSDRQFTDTDPKRVRCCKGKGFGYDPVMPWRARDLRRFVSQQIRYRHRELQIARLLGTNPRALPETMDEINREILALLRGQKVPGFEAAVMNLQRRHSIYDKPLRNRLEALYPSENAMPLVEIRASERRRIGGIPGGVEQGGRAT